MTKWDKNVDHFHILKYLKPIHMNNTQATQPLQAPTLAVCNISHYVIANTLKCTSKKNKNVRENAPKPNKVAARKGLVTKIKSQTERLSL